MQLHVQPQPGTRSLDELEKAVSSHEKHDIDSLSESHQDREKMTVDEESAKRPTLSTPNCSDWDGPDDPDNPHNCMDIRTRYNLHIVY